METTAEKFRAFAFSIGIHVAVLLIVTVGIWWTRSTVAPSIPGPIIEATLVGAPAAPKPKTTRPKPAEPKPEPEKPKPPEPPAPEPPKQDTKDQERVTELAAAQAAEEKRVQEERRKREQILLEEEQKKQEAEKKKKLEEEKKQQQRDRQLKDLADKEKKLEQQRLAELLEAEEATTGEAGQDDSLDALYFAAIRNAVKNAWLRPESTQPGLRCTLEIVQLPGGELMAANVGAPCNADPLTRESLEQAVHRAAPLPYKGFEKQFRRQIKLNFTYDGG